MSLKNATELHSKRTMYMAIAIVGMMFFIFGFVSWVNAILIPYFRIACELTNFQSYLVTFAFYIAYTVGSLIYYSISKSRGEDILNKMGYKNGIALRIIHIRFFLSSVLYLEIKRKVSISF